MAREYVDDRSKDSDSWPTDLIVNRHLLDDLYCFPLHSRRRARLDCLVFAHCSLEGCNRVRVTALRCVTRPRLEPPFRRGHSALTGAKVEHPGASVQSQRATPYKTSAVRRSNPGEAPSHPTAEACLPPAPSESIGVAFDCVPDLFGRERRKTAAEGFRIARLSNGSFDSLPWSSARTATGVAIRSKATHGCLSRLSPINFRDRLRGALTSREMPSQWYLPLPQVLSRVSPVPRRQTT